jgi:hypothetical protein
MNKPVRSNQTPVEVFNREVDQVIHGGAVPGNDLPPEEARALQLVQNLVTADFSGSSNIRQSLRRRFSERSSRYPARFSRLNSLFLFGESRSLAGFGMTVLLGFLLVFGLLSPQHVSATPSYTTMAASAALPDQPAVSLTVAVSHNQDFHPRPVPTPLAMSASTGQSSTLPERTPVLTDPSLGNQFPIITTTISK